MDSDKSNIKPSIVPELKCLLKYSQVILFAKYFSFHDCVFVSSNMLLGFSLSLFQCINSFFKTPMKTKTYEIEMMNGVHMKESQIYDILTKESIPTTYVARNILKR